MNLQQIVRATPKTNIAQTVFRLLLGAMLIFAGATHLTVAREEFQAQVPTWLPLDKDFVVLASGIVEILLGGSLVGLSRYKVAVGWVVAAFFVAIFPGNISQYVNHIDAFGMNTDEQRAFRLIWQPVLVIWALWSTGAWQAWRESKTNSPHS